MTVHHLDRVVRLPVKTLDQIARENEGLPDLYECLGAMSLRTRATRASHRARILGLGLTAGIAIAVTYVLLVAALVLLP
jgi:hypothetical protein